MTTGRITDVGPSRRRRSRRVWLGALVLVAAFVGGCAPTESTESMPAPASVWLTSDPAVPTAPVRVEMTHPDSGDFHREHTFAAGQALRGSFPVSSGRYRLLGMGGACLIDVDLGAEREIDIVIRVDAGGCTFQVERDHAFGEVTHDEPSVLVAPGG